VTEVGAFRLICSRLGVVWAWSTHATVSASLLPAAGAMQAGLAMDSYIILLLYRTPWLSCCGQCDVDGEGTGCTSLVYDEDQTTTTNPQLVYILPKQTVLSILWREQAGYGHGVAWQ